MNTIIDNIKAFILKAGNWLFEAKPVSVKVVTPKKSITVACKSKSKNKKK
jgi:hypothetical protein